MILCYVMRIYAEYLSQQAPLQIRSHVGVVSSLWVCVCTSLPQYVAGCYTDATFMDAQPEKVSTSIALMRRAAVQFAATLDQVSA